jgi:hypothetical protein
MFVDGLRVSSYGRSFELLPGCHVVTSLDRWGHTGSDAVVVAKPSAVTFAMEMVGGRRYTIVFDVHMRSKFEGELAIRANEVDAQGNLVRTFSPASTEDIAACRQRGTTNSP